MLWISAASGTDLSGRFEHVDRGVETADLMQRVREIHVRAERARIELQRVPVGGDRVVRSREAPARGPEVRPHGGVAGRVGDRALQQRPRGAPVAGLEREGAELRPYRRDARIALRQRIQQCDRTRPVIRCPCGAGLGERPGDFGALAVVRDRRWRGDVAHDEYAVRRGRQVSIVRTMICEPVVANLTPPFLISRKQLIVPEGTAAAAFMAALRAFTLPPGHAPGSVTSRAGSMRNGISCATRIEATLSNRGGP